MAKYGSFIRIGDPFFRKLTDEREILKQICVKRLSTKRGTYWNDPEYGFAVSELINENLTAESLASIPARVEAELEKDTERISTVNVTPYLSGSIDNRKIRLDIRITPTTGPDLSLTIDVSNSGVELLTGAVA